MSNGTGVGTGATGVMRMRGVPTRPTGTPALVLSRVWGGGSLPAGKRALTAPRAWWLASPAVMTMLLVAMATLGGCTKRLHNNSNFAAQIGVELELQRTAYLYAPRLVPWEESQVTADTVFFMFDVPANPRSRGRVPEGSAVVIRSVWRPLMSGDLSGVYVRGTIEIPGEGARQFVYDWRSPQDAISGCDSISRAPWETSDTPAVRLLESDCSGER